MHITWLGHACFALEEQGYRIVIDPYRDVEGYPPLREAAQAVYCSHGHFDHCAVECVQQAPVKNNPFTVQDIASFHDECGGAKRGVNTIRVFTAGGVSVAHLGDLGHALSGEQIAAIGTVDMVLVPVGGTYTLDAAGAKAVCDALDARCVVPMHYRHAPYGLPNVDGVEKFLSLWKDTEIHRLRGAAFEAEAYDGVVVPRFES